MANTTTWQTRDNQSAWVGRGDPKALAGVVYILRALSGTLVSQSPQYLSATWTTRDENAPWDTRDETTIWKTR